MDVPLEYTVPSMPNIVVIAHRPNDTQTMQRLQADQFERRPDGQQERQMRWFVPVRVQQGAGVAEGTL
jgi:putative transposase